MIATDDPRHGSVAGHVAGCRSGCCSSAKFRYDKQRKLEAHYGHRRTQDRTGTHRRIRALQALGYSMSQIGAGCGLGAATIHNLVDPRFSRVYIGTAEAVARGYDTLCMSIPQGGYALRNRRLAARNGWLPPLAWDDIDTDPEPPTTTPCPVDSVVVDRILGGDLALAATVTRAERRLVCLRWPGSLQELERLTGWNVWRERRAA